MEGDGTDVFAVLGRPKADGVEEHIGGQVFAWQGGILRQQRLLSDAQAQTADTFGYKWQRADSYESDPFLEIQQEWLREKYGDPAIATWWDDYDKPVLLDVGCGAGLSAIEVFGTRLEDVRYIGVDVSLAVDVAAKRFAARGLPASFLQADLVDLPMPAESVHVVFAEGVLHHTDDAAGALERLARLLVDRGRILFYVYRRKGPIREFTDDYIRDRIGHLDPDRAWDALLPLTELGRVLGDLDVVLDVPEPIAVLEIPAGPIPLQRLFYWHVCKMFYRPEMTLEEMNHINFDWFAPSNASRQTPEEVRAWCADAGLVVEREHLQESGITIVARKV
jgi:arsenite methyltransferase